MKITLYVFSIILFANIGMSSFVPLIPVLSSYCSCSIATATLTYSFYYLGFGTMQLFFGYLHDRFSEKIVLFTTLFLTCLTSILLSASSSIEAFIGGMFCLGASMGGACATGYSMLRSHSSEKGAKNTFSSLHIGKGAVLLCAPLLSYFALSTHNPTYLFYGFSVIAAFYFIITLWIPKPLPKEKTRFKEGLASILTKPLLLKLLPLACMQALFALLLTAIPSLFPEIEVEILVLSTSCYIIGSTLCFKIIKNPQRFIPRSLILFFIIACLFPLFNPLFLGLFILLGSLLPLLLNNAFSQAPKNLGMAFALSGTLICTLSSVITMLAALWAFNPLALIGLNISCTALAYACLKTSPEKIVN